MNSIFNILLLLAAAQGFFLSLLILHKHDKLPSNVLLATLMLLISGFLLHLYIGETGLLKTHHLIPDMIIGLAFLIGPLQLFYVKALVHHWTKIPSTVYYHALPFFVYECMIILYHILVNKDASLYYTRLDPLKPTLFYYLYHWSVISSAGIYFIAAIKLIQQYSLRIKDMFSTTEHIKLTWLRNLNAIILFVIAEYALENVLLLFGINLSNYFDLTSVLLAICLYAIGYIGLLKTDIFTSPSVAHGLEHLPNISGKPVSEKYKKSGLTKERSREIIKELQHLMNTREPFTDSNLTLEKLAQILNVSSHNLSQVINTKWGQNFYDFINSYRVDKVKKEILKPENTHLKLLAIAQDAGFRKSSFNSIFKKHVRLTPSEYREKYSGHNSLQG